MKREWKKIKDYKEILFDFYEGIARITINRERYRNAFTPTTTAEMSDALYYCRECPDINVVVLTGAGDIAFCAGGDMHVKGRGGYIDEVRVVDAPNEDGPYLEQAVKLIDDMLVKQTPSVDTVSGTTFSSAGIINGAVQALETSNSGQTDAAASLEGGE